MKKALVCILLSLVMQSSFAQIDSNKIFRASKGTWKYPVSNCRAIEADVYLNHADNLSLYLMSDSSYPVSSIFEGEVILNHEYDSVYMVVVMYGDYFIGYSNLTAPMVKKRDKIVRGQVIGNMGKDVDEYFGIEIQLAYSAGDIDIKPWFVKLL